MNVHSIAPIAVLMALALAPSAYAQSRANQRNHSAGLGEITIKYNTNRWVFATSYDKDVETRFVCRTEQGLHCGTVRVEVADKANICRAETVNDLWQSKLPLDQNWSLLSAEVERKTFGKLTMHVATRFSRCRGVAGLSFACGEYRGKTYTMWLVPSHRDEHCGVAQGVAKLNELLSGIE